MIWTTINIVFFILGILFITASDYFNKNKHDDILEVLMCGAGIICIFISIISGLINWGFG